MAESHARVKPKNRFQPTAVGPRDGENPKRRRHQHACISSLAARCGDLSGCRGTRRGLGRGSSTTRWLRRHAARLEQRRARHDDRSESRQNAWGLGAGPTTSPWWVADNGTGASTLYNGAGAGAKIPLTVTVGDGPTGLVFNTPGLTDPTAFDLKGGDEKASLFLFDSEAGTITAWNRSLVATAEKSRSTGPRRELSSRGSRSRPTSAGPRLYATDFHNRRSTSSTAAGNRCAVRSSSPTRDPAAATRRSGSRRSGIDSSSPTRRRRPMSNDEKNGPGFGFVDAFDAATAILFREVATRGALNAPRGIAQAPDGFGLLRRRPPHRQLRRRAR